MGRWDRLSLGEWDVLEHVFWAGRLSRAELATRSGFSKSKVNGAVANLIDADVLDEAGAQSSSGGRRPEGLSLSRRLGLLAAVDLGATSLDIALLSPDMEVLAHCAEPADVLSGPGVVMPRVRRLLKDLLAQTGNAIRDVMAIGMGVPGPVEFGAGLLVNPPIMPGWEGFSIREVFGEDYAAPAFIDNDVNVMALGELWRLKRVQRNFLVVKLGTGIGCGVVCHGEVYRGNDGSAGDVGHICVDPAGRRCHCGNVGCVEAMAAGPAIAEMATEAARADQSAMLAERLAAAGVLTPVDVGQAARQGDAAANAIIQRAGQLIGQMLATTVSFYNPSHIYICGGLARLGPLLLASIRQSVYHRSLALSTRHLEIQYAPLGERAGVIGAGVLALQETLRARGVRP